MHKLYLPFLFFILIGVIGYLIYNNLNQPKIAFVDLEIIFSEFNLKKELEYKFETYKNKKKNEIDSLEQITQFYYDELSKKNSLEIQQKFDFAKKTFIETKEFTEIEMRQLSQKYDNQILTQINQYIDDFGKSQSYSIIIGSQGNGTVMYGDSTYNITMEITRFINNKYEGAIE